MLRLSKQSSVVERRGVSRNVVSTVALLVAAVVVIGGVLYLSRDDRPDGDASTSSQVLHPTDSHTVSEGDGSVTVVEFLDYQCPVCANHYHAVTNDIERDYQGEITFVIRNFPLETHPLAEPAARAVEAAALQGAYEQMYHLLFDNYESWALTPDGQSLSTDMARAQARFDSYAEQIKLDVDTFKQDMDSEQVTDRIRQDTSDGEQVGVSGTPTLFVNGQRFEPSGETFTDVAAELRQTIDEQLNQ